MRFVVEREPPAKRRRYCADREHHLSEGAVMVAFAEHLLGRGANHVAIHPDGEHAKRFDLRRCLEDAGYLMISARGNTHYGGLYRLDGREILIDPSSGLGDVEARIEGRTIVAECKGGIVNTRHPGQVSRLRKGLCEAVGMLMARRVTGERQIAVVPRAPVTEVLAARMALRARDAGIEIALVDSAGRVDLAVG